MKVRTDFVTNSSSSSFILAFKDDEDINNFIENCDFYNYKDFYDLIENLSSDFLNFSNDTREPMSIKLLIDKIKHISWGFYAETKMKELYDMDYQLKPLETLSIPINKLNKKFVDLDKINFEEIEEEGQYTIDVTNKKENIDKEKALDDLRWQYANDFIRKLLDEKFNRDNYEDSDDYYDARSEYIKTKECRDLVDNYIKEENYFKQKEKIENAQFIVSGMIWDTSGGLLEWSIRNGFIEDNFHNNCVICYNVG